MEQKLDKILKMFKNPAGCETKGNFNTIPIVWNFLHLLANYFAKHKILW